MKKIFYLAIVFFAILLIQTKTFAKNIEENRAYFPPVIMYHDIRTEPLNFMDVTVENFAKQLDFLQKDGWQTLSMDEFVKIIESKKILEKITGKKVQAIAYPTGAYDKYVINKSYCGRI